MSRRPVLLALRALNVGDLLVAVPALRGLRRGFPGHEVVLAAPGRLAPLAVLTGAVDRLLPHRGLAPPALPGPDVAVDLHGVLPDSVQALAALRPGRLVAFRCAAHPGGPEPVPGDHERLRWCRLLADAGIDADPADLLLARPAVAPLRYGTTVVHPGAAWGSKRWPVRRFAQVARRLARQGHDVVVTGGDGERELAAQVVARAGLPQAADLGGRTDLTGLVALVAAARLVVSGDTATAHLASAYARPSVVLFGPASPRLWGPPDRPWHRALRHGDDGERDVLVDTVDPALLAIGVDEVVDAALAVVREGPGAVRPPAPPRP